MAEICLEYLRKELSNKHYKKRHVVLDLDFCENYREWKECVIAVRYQPFWFIIWW